jgi:hypothetical protein
VAQRRRPNPRCSRRSARDSGAAWKRPKRAYLLVSGSSGRYAGYGPIPANQPCTDALWCKRARRLRVSASTQHSCQCPSRSVPRPTFCTTAIVRGVSPTGTTGMQIFRRWRVLLGHPRLAVDLVAWGSEFESLPAHRGEAPRVGWSLHGGRYPVGSGKGSRTAIDAYVESDTRRLVPSRSGCGPTRRGLGGLEFSSRRPR